MPESKDQDEPQEMEILLEALEISDLRARADFLDQACGDDPALRASVEGLLKQTGKTSGFLDNAAFDLDSSFANQSPNPPEAPGTIIDAYTLREKVGEGGCGVVYRATQEKPIKREVALKVIKLGMDTRDVIARFNAERQALARMNHPHVAKVIDGGATSTGRPYFVMEWVPGSRITDYCDQHRLSIEQRINLFKKVCSAVQHAHQKGIIHRDLKPSNILVTTTDDGKALPKVIDFGIAKATGEQLTDLTLVTRAENFLGTPAYASPEQAGGAGEVDTQTDVYSLGVVLYEIMTGHTPFEARELQDVGPLGMRRIIIERKPQRPSNRLTTLEGGEQGRITRLRQSDPGKLRFQLRGDLDRVVMKALEKDKEQRYQTAIELREDLERFLQNKPVTATPPSSGYRVRKFVRRNRIGVTVAALMVAVIVTGIVLNVRETRRATRAEAVATVKQKEALVAAQKSEQTARIMSVMMDAATPAVAAGRDPKLLWEILEAVGRRIDSETNLYPEVEAELLEKLGDLWWRIGRGDESEKAQRRRLKIQEELCGANHPRTMEVIPQLCRALEVQGKDDEVVKWRREYLHRTQSRYGTEHPRVADALSYYARSLHTLKRYEEAATLQRKGIAMMTRLPGSDPMEIAQARSFLGRSLRRQQKYDEAEEEFLKSKELRSTHGPPGSITESLHDLGAVARSRGELDQAEAYAREALETRVRHQGADHPDTSHAHAHLGRALSHQRNYPEAEQHYRECLRIRSIIYPEEHLYVVEAKKQLARTLNLQGRTNEARILLNGKATE